MKNLIRVGLALGAMLLVGCGGRPLAAGKEPAANALFQASRGAVGVPGSGGLAQLMNSAAIGEVKINCTRGGSFTFKVSTDSSGQQSGAALDMSYDGCSWNGHTSLRGTLHMTMEVVSSETSASLALHLKGRVEFSGDVSDFVDTDITETVVVSDLSSAGVHVSLVLSGTITNRSGTYSYQQETVVIDGSSFEPAPEQG